MKDLADVRRELIDLLWARFKGATPEAVTVSQGLARAGEPLVLDHLAIIDLPGPASGIPVLREIFSALGFKQAGEGYLPEKANGFVWMREPDFENLTAHTSLPQIVLADFNLEECSPIARSIVRSKTARCMAPVSADEIRALCEATARGDFQSGQMLMKALYRFLFEFQYERPTAREFEMLLHENELMAWTLLFGREVNHFAFSVYLNGKFQSLEHFNQFAVHDLHLYLNEKGGFIKGSPAAGLEQSSTVNSIKSFKLEGGDVRVPNRFVEFIWRHSRVKGSTRWTDLYANFVASHANRVVESLYTTKAPFGFSEK